MSLEDLRRVCLRRGAAGIKTLAKTFKIFDDNGNRNLSYEEFKKGLETYDVWFKDEDTRSLFNQFDKNGNGTIDFNEFLEALRPPMSKVRTTLIKKAFDLLDTSQNGVITMEDIFNKYDVTKHPKYKSGEWTKARVLEAFLSQFEVGPESDNKVTFEEFLNYYAGVSASIDKDVYFDFMMRQSWKF